MCVRDLLCFDLLWLDPAASVGGNSRGVVGTAVCVCAYLLRAGVDELPALQLLECGEGHLLIARDVADRVVDGGG